jgi:hypothetical protein
VFALSPSGLRESASWFRLRVRSMPLTDRQLDQVVDAWKEYAESSPDRLDARDVLEKRDLNMYRGVNFTEPPLFAQALTNDRSVATLEMTMGHLYERALEELGPRKVSRDEKKRDGYKGIDFIQDTPDELRLINLKAGLSTSNGDITTSTVNNLAAASQYWSRQPVGDDNPLKRRERKVVKIRAVARGPRRTTRTAEGILWLVGDSMWEYFGAGSDLLVRLGIALQRNPFDHVRFQAAKTRAAQRVLSYLERGGFLRDGKEIDWEKLCSTFP